MQPGSAGEAKPLSDKWFGLKAPGEVKNPVRLEPEGGLQELCVCLQGVSGAWRCPPVGVSGAQWGGSLQPLVLAGGSLRG